MFTLFHVKPETADDLRIILASDLEKQALSSWMALAYGEWSSPLACDLASDWLDGLLPNIYPATFPVPSGHSAAIREGVEDWTAVCATDRTPFRTALIEGIA